MKNLNTLQNVVLVKFIAVEIRNLNFLYSLLEKYLAKILPLLKHVKWIAKSDEESYSPF